MRQLRKLIIKRNDKRLGFFLLKRFSVNRYREDLFNVMLGIKSNIKIKELNINQLLKTYKLIEFFLLEEFQIKKVINVNKKLTIDYERYKGLRRLQGLPVRGQRTQTNAKTVRKLEITFKLGKKVKHFGEYKRITKEKERNERRRRK
jgi:small subunit ribosomal protein S13